MAYWRSYRKFSAEAIALASSDDVECNEEDSPEPLSPACSSDLLQDNHSDEISNHSDSDNPELIYSSASDTEIPESESEENVPAHSNDPSETLRGDLAIWATKNKCQRTAVNELLQILRGQGLCLPKDSRTLLQTRREVVTSSKCGGQSIYLGIEAGITDILSRNSSLIEKHTKVDLMINVDGLPLFKSSTSHFWPILGYFNRSLCCCTFLW